MDSSDEPVANEMIPSPQRYTLSFVPGADLEHKSRLNHLPLTRT